MYVFVAGQHQLDLTLMNAMLRIRIFWKVAPC